MPDGVRARARRWQAGQTAERPGGVSGVAPSVARLARCCDWHAVRRGHERRRASYATKSGTDTFVGKGNANATRKYEYMIARDHNMI